MAPTCGPPEGRPGRGEKPRPDEPADHALGRSRGGFGSKPHLVCDANRVPLAVVVTAGQRQECTHFETVLDAVRVKRRAGGGPAAGRGRVDCRRNAVERWVHRPRRSRRVGTRYQERATSDLAVVPVARIRECLETLTAGLSDTP